MAREIFGAKQETVVQASSGWQCTAFGCKLPGGLSQGLGQEAKYYCRFHYGKKPFENDFITRILHFYQPIFDSIYAIRNVEDVIKIGVHLETIGRPDLGPQQEETYFPHFYRDRLLKVVGTEIADKIKAEKDARTNN